MSSVPPNINPPNYEWNNEIENYTHDASTNKTTASAQFSITNFEGVTKTYNVTYEHTGNLDRTGMQQKFQENIEKLAAISARYLSPDTKTVQYDARSGEVKKFDEAGAERKERAIADKQPRIIKNADDLKNMLEASAAKTRPAGSKSSDQLNRIQLALALITKNAPPASTARSATVPPSPTATAAPTAARTAQTSKPLPPLPPKPPSAAAPLKPPRPQPKITVESGRTQSDDFDDLLNDLLTPEISRPRSVNLSSASANEEVARLFDELELQLPAKPAAPPITPEQEAELEGLIQEINEEEPPAQKGTFEIEEAPLEPPPSFNTPAQMHKPIREPGLPPNLNPNAEEASKPVMEADDGFFMVSDASKPVATTQKEGPPRTLSEYALNEVASTEISFLKDIKNLKIAYEELGKLLPKNQTLKSFNDALEANEKVLNAFNQKLNEIINKDSTVDAKEKELIELYTSELGQNYIKALSDMSKYIALLENDSAKFGKLFATDRFKTILANKNIHQFDHTVNNPTYFAQRILRHPLLLKEVHRYSENNKDNFQKIINDISNIAINIGKADDLDKDAIRTEIGKRVRDIREATMAPQKLTFAKQLVEELNKDYSQELLKFESSFKRPLHSLHSSSMKEAEKAVYEAVDSYLDYILEELEKEEKKNNPQFTRSFLGGVAPNLKGLAVQYAVSVENNRNIVIQQQIVAKYTQINDIIAEFE